MGISRPSLVVQRYWELYSQERVEAYEAITDVSEHDTFIPEFLLDILKVETMNHTYYMYMYMY